jgi:hypothetical protein
MPDEQTTSNNQTQQTPTPAAGPEQGQGANQPPKETIKEIHHHHYDRGRRFFPRFFWGIFIIFLGLVFLAQAVGIISGTNVGEFFARIWPVFIIFVGLSILSRGGFISGLLSAIISIMLMAVIFLSIIGVPIFGTQNLFNSNSQRQIQTQEISIDKQPGAQSANVKINAGAGQISISGVSDKLVTGSLISNITTLETSSQLSDSVQNADISLKGGNWNFGGHYTNNLTVNLSSSTPINLNVNAGAASQNLDLSEVQITGLNINAGASSINLTLGDKVDNATVSIDSGASSVHIILPKTVGAKVTADGGLTSRNFTDFKQLGNNTYQSNNYDQSAKKINLTLHGGASSFNIDWK